MNKIRPADLPATGWTRIDVGQIWASELLPLLEASSDLQRSLEAAMADWIDSLHDGERPAAPWRWAEADDLPPFLVARGDRAWNHISDRIHTAAEAYNSRALAYQALSTLLFDIDLGLPAKMQGLLETKQAEMWDEFVPRRDEVLWVRPDASCHWFVSFELALAQAWRPEIYRGRSLPRECTDGGRARRAADLRSGPAARERR